MRILISGFPYVRKNILEVFDFYPKGDELFFLLPLKWPIKGGKVVYSPPIRNNIIPVKSFFTHSDYFIIGGMLKGWIPSFPYWLWRLGRKGKIDLVFSCSEPALLTTLYQAIITRLYGTKHVCFTWENIDYRKKFKGFKGWIKLVILKLNLLLSDGVICGNQKAYKIIDSYTPSRPHPLIPASGVNGVFFKKLDIPKQFRGYDLSGKVVYAFVGSISYRKGIHLIIKAFQDLVKEIPNAVLYVVGSGEDDYEREIEKLILESGVKEKIFRFPWISHEDMKELLSVSDVFVYPSLPYKGWEDQLGYATMEASLMELPVITAYSGSMDEVVKDGETGFLVEPPYDVKGVYEPMLKLGKDKELREGLGKKAREFMIANFSHEAVAQKFWQFFHGLKK